MEVRQIKENKFYGWTLVLVLSIVYFLNTSLPMYGAGVINSYMSKSLNMNRAILGLGVTAFSLTHSLLSPITARTVNKLGARITLFIGGIILTLGAFLMSFLCESSVSYIVIYGLIMGFGFGLGAMIPVQTTITLWFKKKKALALSIVLAAAGLGGFIASPTVSKIIELANGDWRVAWIFVSIMMAISSIISILFVRNKPSDLNQIQDGFTNVEKTKDTTHKKTNVYQADTDWVVSEAFKTKSLWLMVIASVSFQIAYLTTLGHNVINMMDKGISNEMAAMSLGLITLFSIVGRLTAGYLGDKFEPRFLYALALVLFAVGSVFSMYVTNNVHVIIYAICAGLGIGVAMVSTPTLYGNYFGAGVFASIQGAVFPIQASIGAMAPLLAGVLYDKFESYNIAFTFMSIMLVIGAISIYFAKPPLQLD